MCSNLVPSAKKSPGPVKKLNCLNDVLCFFVLVKSYREKKK